MGVVSLQLAQESIIIKETTMNCNLVENKSGGLRNIIEIRVRGKTRLANTYYVAFTNALNTLNEAVSAMYPNSTLALHRRRVAPRSNPSH
jgi:hypothetical protein